MPVSVKVIQRCTNSSTSALEFLLTTYQDDQEVEAQWIQEFNDEEWPWFPLASNLHKLAGIEAHEIELYDIATRSWLRIRLGHVIALTNNLHVFI